MLVLEHAAHPHGDGVEMGLEPHALAAKIPRGLDAGAGVDHHRAVTELHVREHRYCRHRHATAFPTQVDTHLKLAHVELEVAREAGMPLLGNKRYHVQVEPRCGHLAVDQEAGAVVVTARKRQAEIRHNGPDTTRTFPSQAVPSAARRRSCDADDDLVGVSEPAPTRTAPPGGTG